MVGDRAQGLRRFVPFGLAMIVLVVIGVFAYRGFVLSGSEPAASLTPLAPTASHASSEAASPAPSARPAPSAPVSSTPTAGVSRTPTPAPRAAPSANPSVSSRAGGSTGAAALAALDAAYRATLSVAVLDLTTGGSLTYNSANSFYTASIAKVDIVEALLLRAQDRGRSLTSTERGLARAAITASDNEAAQDLFERIGQASGLTAANKRLGLTSTVVSSAWGLTRTSATDQVTLLRALTSTSGPLSSASKSYLMGLMSSVEADQRWGVPVAGNGTPIVKNGWLPVSRDGGAWEVNSIGVVTSSGHKLLVAVLTRKGTSMAAGIQLVEKAATIAVASLMA